MKPKNELNHNPVDYISEDQMQELEDIIFDRCHASATCDHCGYTQEVEPDADYPCMECGEGRLISPLRKLGLI